MSARAAERAARLALALLALASRPATATVTLIQPGPEGSDVAPYSFIPTLLRGNRDTQYAFTDVDENDFSHAFETFVHFPLPPDLVPPGEEVSEAYAWIVYSFDFTGFGDPTATPGEIACHEVLAPWSEATVNWLNKPPYGPVFDAHTGVAGLGLVWCDVTALVDAWWRGDKPNHGLALTNSTPRLIGFYSFEAPTGIDPNLRPTLVVETLPIAASDGDGDGVRDASDNCRGDGNAAQQDGDFDGVGDACDACPAHFDPAHSDSEGHGAGAACGVTGADLTADARIDEADLLEFVRRASLAPAGGALDLDGDGVVGPADLELWLGVHGTHFTGPTAGQLCGALDTESLLPLARWWVARGARPTREFMDCYALP